MQSSKEMLFNHLDNIRKDIIADLHAKDISKGDLGMQIKQKKNEGALWGYSYWYFLVFGRKPGKQPPIESIMDWIERKGITASIGIKSLAFLIARKIGKLGTDIYRGERPGLYLFTILDARNREFKEQLTDFYRTEISREIKLGLTSIFHKK